MQMRIDRGGRQGIPEKRVRGKRVHSLSMHSQATCQFWGYKIKQNKTQS